MLPLSTSSEEDRSITARTMRILMAFDRSNSTLTASELCRRSGLPVATTYRLMTKLLALGALERRGGGEYSIGLRLWEAVSGAPLANLRHAALPHMLRLSVRTRAAVLLGIRDAGEIVLLEVLPGQVHTAALPRSGDRVPPDGIGMGLLLPAPAQDPEAYALVAEPVERSWPDNDVHAVRTGHIVVAGRLKPGVTEVVAAIRSPEGRTLAALGVAGEMGRAHVPGAVQAVMCAADALSGKNY